MDRNAPMKITELGFLDFIGVKYTTVLEQNIGFSAFILKVLQYLHKSCRKRNPNEITDYFVCTANAYAWMSCILCQYAPARTIGKTHKTYNGSEP